MLGAISKCKHVLTVVIAVDMFPETVVEHQDTYWLAVERPVLYRGQLMAVCIGEAAPFFHGSDGVALCWIIGAESGPI